MQNAAQEREASQREGGDHVVQLQGFQELFSPSHNGERRKNRTRRDTARIAGGESETGWRREGPEKRKAWRRFGAGGNSRTRRVEKGVRSVKKHEVAQNTKTRSKNITLNSDG